MINSTNIPTAKLRSSGLWAGLMKAWPRLSPIWVGSIAATLTATAASFGPPAVQGFTAYGGRWQVADGILYVRGGPGPKLVWDGAPFAAGEAGVEIWLADRAAGNAGLLVKVSDPGVGADRFNGYEIALDAQAQVLRLGRHRQSFELIRDVPCPVPTGEWIPLAVRMTETVLEVLVQGESRIRHEEAGHALKVGTVGLRPWQRPVSYRNFWVQTNNVRQALPFNAPDPATWTWPDTLSLDGLPPVLFLRRHMLTAPPAVGCDHWAARPTAPGCALSIWHPDRPEEPPQTIFQDPDGCIYDLNLSLDARAIFFSYARKGEKHWHLWRIGLDGSGLRQLTDGPFYDVSPCETPDGYLVFVSTRRFGHTVCQPGPASNLYRIPADGGTPECLSMNTLSDTTPQLLPDGRVLFMRWEYVDRDLTYRQSLWTQNPDGTGYQLYFGNTVRDPGTFWQARPIPGRSDRVLATFAPHHGYPHGAIGWIERQHGTETARGVGFDWITQEFPTIGDQAHAWSYRDPFPLDEQRFLCAYGGDGERFGIYLHDVQDRRRRLFADPDRHCFVPVALRPTPTPPVVAPRAPANLLPAGSLPEDQPADAPLLGTCVLVDVYEGLGPAIERGRVKSIRIMEQVRKTEDIPVEPHTLDFGPRAYDQSPLMSYGTYYAKRCWGSVPVEPDGSACFQVPALREIYFQACDAEGRELQRMTSAAQCMPGEVLGCVGCHEPRTTAPRPGRSPLALRRPPSVPQKPEWAPDGIIDFVHVVQPVLDRYCVECHSGGDPKGGYDFSGDKTRFFNMAYDNLLGRSRSYRQHKLDTGEMLPAEAAKGKPLVHFFWLLQTPTAVNRPLWAGSHASRLIDHLKIVPPEDRERIHTWIDADVPYYGTYATTRPRSGGKRDLCADPLTGEPAEWFAHGFLPLYARRCASCHGDFPGTLLVTCWDGRTAWINFTRPQFSPALTAHLPKAAGGRGIDRTAEGQPIPMFADTLDPDYQTLLRAIETGRQQALAQPGPDMPGFAAQRREP